MGDLKPLGSERLEGSEKLKRIMEIANYGKSQSLTEETNTSADYSIQLADGNYYGIVKEKLGYIIKRGLNESELDYIDVIENRKYLKSFSQAMKKINLIAGELNRVNGVNEQINLIGEQKKFVLKTPKSEKSDEETPVSDETDLNLDMSTDKVSDSGEEDMELDLELDTPEGEEDMDLDLDLDVPEGEEDMETPEDDEEIPSIKQIQKLTGKISQKLRTLEQSAGIQSSDMKYVINSILSAMNLDNLNEEDKEEILEKFESEEAIDYGVDDEAKIDIESGDEDFNFDFEDTEDTEGEMEESDLYNESKIDKVISKYFVITEEEKQISEEKKIKNFVQSKVKKIEVTNEIKKLSETIEQEIASTSLLNEDSSLKFLGKTNLKNLVFQKDDKTFKISPKGELL